MENNKKPIDNIREDLQSVVFNIEVIKRDIEDLRKLNLDCIAKIEKHQEEVKKINNEIFENKKSKGWFF
tara:strand:+ start:307 stop:513 length:207 start_codon:yes stop_codon:yes gene_type:complete